MSLIISIHEYELKPGVDEEEFEKAFHSAKEKGLFNLPGLKEYHLIKGIRGDRKNKYAAIWIYESEDAWEKLWGPVGEPKSKDEYPDEWKRWEDEILSEFLITEPDKITFTSYKDVGNYFLTG